MTTNSGKAFASGSSSDSPAPKRLVPLAVGFLLVEFFLQQLPSLVPELQIPGTGWNWTGKILSVIFSCLVLAFSPWLRQNAGLRWRQSPGSIRWSLISFFACFGIAFATNFHRAAATFSRETVLFQMFMPSLDEELAYRGIAMALLEKAFHQSPMSCRLRYGWAALILSLVFGLGHAISTAGGQIVFLLLPFLLITLYASMVAMVRTRSGSLLWPMLCHSAWNGSFFLIPMLR